MLNNLLFYELILIIAGSILFLALVFALIWNIIKGKSFVALLMFFAIPIVMIGFPAIKTISLSKDKIEISKLAQEVKNDPTDTTAKNTLQSSLENINIDRIKNDPEALMYVADAQYALGNYDTALYFINESLVADPSNTQAMQIKNDIEKQKEIQTNFKLNIESLNNNLRVIEGSDEADEDDANKIRDILSTTDVPVYTDEASTLTVAKSLATINEQEKSLEMVNKVLEQNPTSTEALNLKKQIETNSIKTVESTTPATFQTNKMDKTVIRQIEK